MKYVIALLAVSAVALALLIVHGVVQEMNLHRLKTRTASSALSVDSKEQTIVATKNQVAQLRIAMETERTKAKELAKRHEEIENAKRESEAKLQACNTEKDAEAKKKTETENTINELKENKTVNELKEEIEKTKKLIKNRDQLVCALADQTQDEVKKLCAE
ncbi:unnamed protein product [Tetraodon nigroviridis]|uniref:(spotted green pufferfish) hypothetical protein n=1 Tax=Tetraodon nigroviridis TaxID=99883 RepID=Q4RI88_TETNG|nr:unnamed protein product [Tetraodon nigroviridis]